MLSATRQTEAVLLDRCSKRRAAQLLDRAARYTGSEYSHKESRSKPIGRNVPMERDYWLVTVKSAEIRRQLEGLGFSTSTM